MSETETETETPTGPRVWPDARAVTCTMPSWGWTVRLDDESDPDAYLTSDDVNWDQATAESLAACLRGEHAVELAAARAEVERLRDDVRRYASDAKQAEDAWSEAPFRSWQDAAEDWRSVADARSAERAAARAEVEQLNNQLRSVMAEAKLLREERDGVVEELACILALTGEWTEEATRLPGSVRAAVLMECVGAIHARLAQPAPEGGDRG